MKPTPANNQLDSFIQNALKSPDADLHPFDWSEIEVLLRHEQKSIRKMTTKQSVLIAVAAIIILIVSFGIFKLAGYYSLPEKTEVPIADSGQNTFMAIDTQTSIISDSVIAMVDTVKIDSSRVSHDEEYKTDSLLAVSEAFLKSIKEKQTADATKIIQKQDKKQKQNTTKVLSPPVDTTMKITLPPADTIKIIPPPETKKETAPAPDTVNKTNPGPKKNSKSKKPKSQKMDSPVPAELPKTESPSETKPDSLKQQ